jgi:phage shock protein A
MYAEQLLLFPETLEEKTDRQLREMRAQNDKVRKALFARHGELVKMYLEQKHELETLKAAICKTKTSFF